MKKLFALLLALAMVFAMMTCLTACGDDETDAPAASQNGDNENNNNTNEDSKGDDNTDSVQRSTFTLQDTKFSVIGDYKENVAPSGTAVHLKGDSFSITVNYRDSTSYADTEEATKSNYSSYAKAYPDATLELLQTEDGIYYYTIKGWEYEDQVCIEYVHEGILWSFFSGSFTDEAINAITHITFE